LHDSFKKHQVGNKAHAIGLVVVVERLVSVGVVIGTLIVPHIAFSAFYIVTIQAKLATLLQRFCNCVYAWDSTVRSLVWFLAGNFRGQAPGPGGLVGTSQKQKPPRFKLVFHERYSFQSHYGGKRNNRVQRPRPSVGIQLPPSLIPLIIGMPPRTMNAKTQLQRPTYIDTRRPKKQRSNVGKQRQTKRPTIHCCFFDESVSEFVQFFRWLKEAI
jgi:hypothetical protein